VPNTPSDIIDRFTSELERHNQAVRSLLGLPEQAVRWRPAPSKWSILEHVDHLARTNRLYLEAMSDAVEAARAARYRSDGPFRRGWVGHVLAQSMEPPVKLRMKTFRRLTPPAGLDTAETLGGFLEVQRSLVELADSARGVDLGRARFRSPLLSILPLDVGAALDLVLAHNRRHIWLAERIRATPGLPA